MDAALRILVILFLSLSLDAQILAPILTGPPAAAAPAATAQPIVVQVGKPIVLNKGVPIVLD